MAIDPFGKLLQTRIQMDELQRQRGLDEERRQQNALANRLNQMKLQEAMREDPYKGMTLADLGAGEYGEAGKYYVGPGKKPIRVGATPPKAEDTSKVFDREDKLRSKYLKASEDFVKQRDAYGRIQSSAQDPSAAGDLALIFNYMKVLDPGSTVREGEFANAQNAGGVGDRVVSMYNRVLRGERLSEPQRGDFVDRAGRLYGGAERQHLKRADQYKNLAQRYKLDPSNIVIDLGYAENPMEPKVAEAPERDVVRTGTYMGRKVVEYSDGTVDYAD